MPDPDAPANDNGLDDDEAHYLGLLDTLPAIPAALYAAASRDGLVIHVPVFGGWSIEGTSDRITR